MVKGKYTWTDEKFHKYLNSEAEKLRKALGETKIGTKTASKLLFDKVLVPNKVSLDSLIKNKKRIKKRLI